MSSGTAAGRPGAGRGPTDETLMRAVRDGDVSQLGQLFERYHGRLFEFLSRMTGNRVAAEDLVQDVFVRILKYRGTYRDEGRFDTWLFRIARNARADYFRRAVPVDALPDSMLEQASDTPGPAAQLEMDRDVARLRKALLQLRDDRRELIVLARYQGLRHDQIAELLEIDVGAVKVRLHRAIAELRDVFRQLGDGDPICAVQTPALFSSKMPPAH
jgi:RNA polymerase sigma factor (sigma-70 family)